MDRELVLISLTLCLCGPVLLLSGLLPLRASAHEPARARELGAWWRLWLPILPTASLLGFLIGWALQEPDASEVNLRPIAFIVAVPFAAVWLRASVRAVQALLAQRRVAAAATGGLFRPRAFISPELRDRLDERALRAVLEHEAAHARHFDPLRLWLAQIGTDLQWPAASAQRRFSDWRSALELARDDEACERGVDGSDLAAALIEAARLGDATRGHTIAALVREGGAGALRERVVRLLYRTDGAPTAPARARPGWPLVTVVLAIAIAAGVFVGEELVVNLPGLTH